MAFFEIFSNKKIIEEKPKIIVDIREKNSLVVSELMREKFEIDFQTLKVGDYIVKNTIVERKTVQDFVSSMINKRLIQQLNDLKPLTNKLLLIEGIEEYDLYHEESKVHENAIRGFLLSILLNYQIPIIYTKNSSDTAKFLKVLWKKQEKDKELGINAKRKSRDVDEQMQFILEGFPGIGPKNAKKLLREFKTLKNILNQPIENLEKIIGKKAEIFKIVNKNYSLEDEEK